MDTTESLGYLKGLIEGLDLGDNKRKQRKYRNVTMLPGRKKR